MRLYCQRHSSAIIQLITGPSVFSVNANRSRLFSNRSLRVFGFNSFKPRPVHLLCSRELSTENQTHFSSCLACQYFVISRREFLCCSKFVFLVCFERRYWVHSLAHAGVRLICPQTGDKRILVLWFYNP